MPRFQHGLAAGLDVAGAYQPRGRGRFGQSLKFFVGEAFGLLFILASTAFIFAVPANLTGVGVLKRLVNRMVKRTVDIVSAVVGLILTLPLWVVLPIIIKLDSRGPVFYVQTRVGVNRRRSQRRYHQRADATCGRVRERRREDYMGKPFKVIKFRTMVRDAERESGPVWATSKDPRVTRLGTLMRKTRLDEIPQFINILKGDMSLVGPRPERPVFVRDLSSRVKGYSNRLQVKPGLTGLAQVENGYDSSVSSVVRKVRFDLEYIRNWSLVADLRIILKTVVVVVTGRGAC
ncbi:MAG TPA: sugar transferase [Acidobacteriota bacterium]|nr:sugar transferase [Acidobacteriota bacterium]